MDFIMDNLLWFIIGGIVILMAIIGYFADKTDFGRKTTKEEKPKEEKSKKEKIKVDAKGIGNLNQSVTEKTEDKKENVASEDLYAGIGNTNIPIDKNTVVDDSLFVPLTDIKEEVIDKPVVIPIADTVEPIFNTEEPTIESNAEEELKNVEPEPLVDIALESKKVEQQIAEDDDVWKF